MPSLRDLTRAEVSRTELPWAWSSRRKYQANWRKAKRSSSLLPGNTGVALAMIGSLKGYEVEIVMSNAVSVERRQMIKAFGGTVTLTDGKLGTDGAIRRARELVKENPEKYFMPDQFSNEYNKIAHYGRPAMKSGNRQTGRSTILFHPWALPAQSWASVKCSKNIILKLK